jgi:hypothetical protein
MSISGAHTEEEKHAWTGHVLATNQMHYTMHPLGLQLGPMQKVCRWKSKHHHCNATLNCLSESELALVLSYENALYAPVNIPEFMSPTEHIPGYG